MTREIDHSDPFDIYVELCAVCGSQLGPGIGSRTPNGRCVSEEHRKVGGFVVRVVPAPDDDQPRFTAERLQRIRERPFPPLSLL